MTNILLLANFALLLAGIIYLATKFKAQKARLQTLVEEDDTAEYISRKPRSHDLVKAELVRIVDGDTIEAFYSGNNKLIRLSAIDCPEGDQPWGDKAAKALTTLIHNNHLYLEIYNTEKDTRGRIIATLYTMQGQELINVNEKMVKLGHAWVYRKYLSHLSKSRQVRLSQLEDWAKTKKMGLWKSGGSIHPEKWRNQA